jgi:hypothetical protein
MPFLVREDVPGPSARELVDAGGAMPIERVLAIVGSLLECVQALHDAGTAHLGLGAGCVFVGRDDTIRVTGLGIATAADGTGGIDVARADLRAVAEIAFELLTGTPYDGGRSVREIRPEVPRRVDRAIARGLGPEGFASARSFADALVTPAVGPPDEPRRGVWRTWLAVPIAVGVVAVAAIAVGLWLGRLEVGGPLGIRAAEPSPSAGAGGSSGSTSIRPTGVVAFDPYGDGTENSSLAPLAIDGDLATAWRSEDYFDATLHKPGIGLRFDLGERRGVEGFRLWTPHPGFVFHVAVGDDPATLVDHVGPPITADTETRRSIRGRGRYVLVWITTVVDTGDGNRAEISEFRPVVAADA